VPRARPRRPGDTGQAPGAGSGSTGTGSAGTSAGTGSSAGDSLLDGLASGNQVDAGIGDISPSIPLTVCGNGVGVAGDASAACGSDTSTGGIIAPPPEEPGGTDTGTSGIPGTQGSTGTSGLIATGLTLGSSGGAGDSVASFAPLRPPAAGSGALLAAGLLVVRATRPDTARKGGGDR
jgi:hypothetical protein